MTAFKKLFKNCTQSGNKLAILWMFFPNFIESFNIDNLPKELLFEAKQKGYADRQIAHLTNCLESEVYNQRNELNKLKFQ